MKGGQVGLALRSKNQDLGIPMKVEIQSDNGDFFDGSIGSRTTNETHSYTILLGTRTSARWRPQYQEDAYCEKLCRCWKEASLCFSTTTTLQLCRLCILLTMDPTLHYKMYQGSQLLKRADVGGAEQTIASMGREHQDGCKAERNH